MGSTKRRAPGAAAPAAAAEFTVPHVWLLRAATESDERGHYSSASHGAGHAPTEPAFLHKTHQNTFGGRDGGAPPPALLSTATAAGAEPAAAPPQGRAPPPTRLRRRRSRSAASRHSPPDLRRCSAPPGAPANPCPTAGPSARIPGPTWLNLSTMPRQVEHARRRRSPAPRTGGGSNRAAQSSTAKATRDGRGAGPGRGEGPGPMARSRDPWTRSGAAPAEPPQQRRPRSPRPGPAGPRAPFRFPRQPHARTSRGRSLAETAERRDVVQSAAATLRTNGSPPRAQRAGRGRAVE